MCKVSLEEIPVRTLKEQEKAGKTIDCDACLTLSEGDREGKLSGSMLVFPAVYADFGKGCQGVLEPKLAIRGGPYLPGTGCLSMSAALSHWLGATCEKLGSTVLRQM